MCFCASLLCISVVTKLLDSFVSALNSRKHMKPNGKNRSVTFPEFFSMYVFYKKKKINLLGSFLQNFGLTGDTESKIYTFWFKKWPTDGPSYDNATTMFSIRNVHYQRIICETFYK